jgi:hypothetical protein
MAQNQILFSLPASPVGIASDPVRCGLGVISPALPDADGTGIPEANWGGVRNCHRLFFTSRQTIRYGTATPGPSRHVSF